MIPIWAVATIAFILCLVFVGNVRPQGAYDLGSPLFTLLSKAGIVIAYLIFWVIYLAV